MSGEGRLAVPRLPTASQKPPRKSLSFDALQGPPQAFSGFPCAEDTSDYAPAWSKQAHVFRSSTGSSQGSISKENKKPRATPSPNLARPVDWRRPATSQTQLHGSNWFKACAPQARCLEPDLSQTSAWFRKVHKTNKKQERDQSPRELKARERLKAGGAPAGVGSCKSGCAPGCF